MLISAKKLGGRKDIESVKSACSICIQSLNPTYNLLFREILKKVKYTRNTLFGHGLK